MGPKAGRDVFVLKPETADLTFGVITVLTGILGTVRSRRRICMCCWASYTLWILAYVASVCNLVRMGVLMTCSQSLWEHYLCRDLCIVFIRYASCQRCVLCRSSRHNMPQVFGCCAATTTGVHQQPTPRCCAQQLTSSSQKC